jgi:hypothetical protein
MARTKQVNNQTVPFTPEEEAARDAEEAEAAVYEAEKPERETESLIALDPRMATVMEVMWQIAKAARTGVWTGFVIDDGAGGTKPVTNKPDFRQYVKETYIANSGA